MISRRAAGDEALGAATLPAPVPAPLSAPVLAESERSDAKESTDRDEVEQLLVDSLPRRARNLSRLELSVELSLTALFLGIFIGLDLSGTGFGSSSPIVLAMVLAYAIASRVDYPIATGVAVPTQPFLVGLFAYADARLVPGLVFASLVVGTIGACVNGRSRWDRLSFCGGDAMHALGPAIVFTAAGFTDASEAPVLIIATAFAAQCAAEFATSTARDWIVAGVRPRLQVLVSEQVWALDAALTPIGIMAVATAEETGMDWVPLAVLPLIALVAYSARDRTDRLDLLRGRLDAAQRERERLQVAVKRIGDAFAAKLDLDALLNIMGGAVVEALDADSGRGSVGAGSRPTFLVRGQERLEGLIDRAEREAFQSGVMAEAENTLGWALAAPINPAGTVAVVTVARDSAPFSDSERELVSYLCLQAAVAAGDIARHEVLNRQALTDELTGVANHRSFQEVLEEAFNARSRTGAGMSLLLLDLDNFKEINDTYGHQTGDRVLSAVGRCLQRHCRAEDQPARYGGEELAILLPDTEMTHATQLAERLRREVEALRFYGPFGEPVSVTASFGVASADSGAPDKAALIAAADSALYEAKMSGKNRVCTAATWSPQGEAGTPRSARDLPSQLARGLENEELVLHYQPKIELENRRLVGVEALTRWHHPELGLLAPARFLPWAEGTDLMPKITMWVLKQALTQATAWRRGGLRLPVAVNIGAQDLADTAFPLAATRVLREAGAQPEDLTLEITEHMAIAAGQTAGRVLADLRRAGITISMDDFGSGHSSLTRLRDLQVDELKLDRGLVRQTPGTSDLAVLRAAIALGHDLGLAVVAEGVEDAESLDMLTAMDCDLAQGYHICPPLLPHELERWTATQHSEGENGHRSITVIGDDSGVIV
jgi:diguanylate cyclase (GGDEF)-like protein